MNGRADRDPEVARRFFEAASAHAAAGRYQEAIDAYTRVIEVMPEVEAAHFNLGNVWFALKDFQRAADSYRRAATLKSEPASLNNLGNALGAAGDLEGAIQAFQDALALDEQFAPALNNLGKAYLSLGRPDKALKTFEEALRRHHDHPTTRRLMGDCLASLNRPQEAIEQYESALAVAGKQVDILVPLGKAHAQIGQLRLAMECLIDAQQQEPNNPRIYGALGEVNQLRGQVGEALLCYARAIQGNPELSAVHGQLLFTLNYDPSVTAAQALAEAQGWSERFLVDTTPVRRTAEPSAGGRRLRIGYVSAGFPSESVSCLLEPILLCHDAATMDVYCYDTKVDNPEGNQRLRAACPNWRNLSSGSDADAAELVRQDEIDVLVDLAGHSCSRALKILARRPASVQATWFGQLGTTGIPQIDYILADPVVIPAKHEAHYSERPVRMPDCYLCYAPTAEFSNAVTRSIQKARSQEIILGCFDEVAKLSPQVVAVWAQILHAVPSSRLLLKNFAFQDKSVQQRVQSLFLSHDVDDAKVTLAGEHGRGTPIEDYHALDIYLSPFPYAGEITSLRALWMGIPVVAKTGPRYAERISESFLRSIGQREWACETDQAYVETAVELASDASRLAKLRGAIHDRMSSSPLCDPSRFTRHLEDIYRRMMDELASKPR